MSYYNLPQNRQDSTQMAGAHAGDHNSIAAALEDSRGAAANAQATADAANSAAAAAQATANGAQSAAAAAASAAADAKTAADSAHADATQAASAAADAKSTADSAASAASGLDGRVTTLEGQVATLGSGTGGGGSGSGISIVPDTPSEIIVSKDGSTWALGTVVDAMPPGVPGQFWKNDLQSGPSWQPIDATTVLPEGGLPGNFLARTNTGYQWATVGGVSTPTNVAVGLTTVRDIGGYPQNLDQIIPVSTTPELVNTSLTAVEVLPSDFSGQAAGSLLVATTSAPTSTGTMFGVRPGASAPVGLPQAGGAGRGVCHLRAGSGTIVVCNHDGYSASTAARPVGGPGNYTPRVFVSAMRSGGLEIPMKFGASAASGYGVPALAAIDPRGTRAWAISPQAVDTDTTSAYLWTCCAYLNPGDNTWTWNDFGFLVALGYSPTATSTPTGGFGLTVWWILAGGGHLWALVGNTLLHKPDDTTTNWAVWNRGTNPLPPANVERVGVESDGSLWWAAAGVLGSGQPTKTPAASIELRRVGTDGTYTVFDTAIPRFVEDGSFIDRGTSTGTYPASFAVLGQGQYAVGGPMLKSQFDSTVTRWSTADRSRPAVWVTEVTGQKRARLLFDGSGCDSQEAAYVSSSSGALVSTSPTVTAGLSGSVSPVPARAAGGASGVVAIRARVEPAGTVGFVAVLHREDPATAGQYIQEAISVEVAV